MTWLYAVSGAPPHDETSGLSPFPLGSLVAWTREAPAPPEPAERWGERLLALFARTDLLPFRHGSSVPSHEALAVLLASRRGEWTRALCRTAGQAEFMVHLELPAPPPGPPPQDGASWLRARAGQLHERSARQHALEQRLAPACAELRALPPRGGTLRIAALAFRSAGPRLERLAAPEGPCVVTGPWPPFSFAGEAP